MKKLLAMVLALVMTLSLAVSANAAFKDVKDIDETYAEAVEVLTGMKVFKGYEDGSFLPKNAITRAEVAAIVYRIYTTDVKDTYVKNYETYNKFADMAGAGWAKGYIGYCANAALVKGYPDGNFKPSGNVTGYEVLAMILRAVGYDQNGEFTGADWALHVAQIAEQAGVLKNVKGVDLNAPATRELVSELLFRSIQVPMVTYTAAFGYEDFVYLFKCEKETWTSGVGQLYTYYGVTSDGEVKEFESYDASRVGTVCYYFLRNDKTYDFAPAPYETDLVSVELLGDKDTVEYRYEGKNTESNIYSNLDKVYDLTDTSDLKAGDKVDTYDWKWQTTKVVEGMLVIDRKDGDVECLFVLDDDVTFGEFKINGVVNGANYWYPVANYNGTKLVERALADLDGGDFKVDKYYHINDADAIKGDAGFKFEAGETYNVVEHKDIVNDIKAVTGATLKDNVLTVPMDAYVADQAADYIETAGTKKLEGNKLTVTLTSEDGICTKDVVITVKSEKFDVTFTTAKMDAAKGAEVVFTGESDLGNPLNKTLVKSVEIVNKEGTLVYALENVSDLNDSIQAIGTSTLTAGKEYTAVVTLLDGTSYSKTLEAQSGIPSGI